MALMHFQYAKVSEHNASFSSYRGIKVLSALYTKVSQQRRNTDDNKTSLYHIHSVRSVPGHLAVSFHDGRQFVVFDAVPHQLRLSSIEETKLERFVLKEVNDYLKNILAMKTLPHVIHLSFLNPSQSTKPTASTKSSSKPKLSSKSSPIARKLQLLAVHSDGGIIIWNWNQIRYLWQYKIRKILPSPLSDATLRQNYMNNTNTTLYDKERPGILVFCSVMPSPPHLIKIPCLNKKNEQNIEQKQSESESSETQSIRGFESLLYPQHNIFIRSSTGSSALPSSPSASTSSFSGHVNHEGSLYLLMIDYMMGDEDMIDHEQSNVYDIHRYLLSKHFPGIATQKTLSTRFIISRVRLDVDYQNINTPSQHMDKSKFADFSILMDGVEEIDFWTQYYAQKEKDNVDDYYCNEDEAPVDERRRVIMIIENVWTTRYGFIIEMTVRRTNNVRKMSTDSNVSSSSSTSSQAMYDVDLSEICIEKRLLYYVSPFMNEMKRIPFPSTAIRREDYRFVAKEKGSHMDEDNEVFLDGARQEITRFMIGQHGTTKQLLLWDRFDNSLYILDENQLAPSSLSEYEYYYHKNRADQHAKHGDKLSARSLQHLAPKFDVPFGHFSDRSRRIEWKYICRFDVPNEAFYDPSVDIADAWISKAYKHCNQRLKIWGYHDWICVSITHDVYYIHLTNIVLHRRHLFHQYKGVLSIQRGNDNDMILSCASSCLPCEMDYFVIDDFGICTRDGIFRLTMPHLHEQVGAVNSCYEATQSVLGGLNLLARWGQTSLIARSKYLTDFLYQQSLNRDVIKSAQMKEALRIAPFPLLTALLDRYPQFDSLLLRHYQRVRDDFPRFSFNYGRIFGRCVMQDVLHYMDHIYRNEAPLPKLNRDKVKIWINAAAPAGFISQDLAILSGQVQMDEDEEDVGVLMDKTGLIHAIERASYDKLDDDLLVDMDQIRTLISSDLPSDLDLLETKLKLDGIRDDPFDPATFETNAQFLCRILLLPASFRWNHDNEMTTPLNLLASLCRFYDLIHPVATFRLVQLLSHYQATSANKIAASALQGLPHVKHDLQHQLLPQTKVFDLFEQRIVARVCLCKIAHRYYEMLDQLLITPLTLSRLNNAISTFSRFEVRLTEIQKVTIFKRLLSAWLQVKINDKENKANIEADWIIQLRPKGYNGFHFIKHIIQEIKSRKDNKINKMRQRIENCHDETERETMKKEVDALVKRDISILAGKGDIPVSVLRPVLMFFASQLQTRR
eukprot:59724_1